VLTRLSRKLTARSIGAAAVLLACTALTATPAQATIVNTVLTGADSCAAPSAATMKNWWTNSPMSWWGIYIGGVNRSCAQPNLTASWVTTVTGYGWYLTPIWVGLQNPCINSGRGSKFSTNTTTAFSQGETEAHSAYAALNALGFTPFTTNNTLVSLDIEAFDTGNAACLAANKAFVDGWDTALAVAPAQWSGVYGSASGTALQSLASVSPPPVFVYGGKWDNVADATSLSPVTSWTHRRLKQYAGGHNQTYGGITISIDSDVSDGPLYHS